MARLLIVDDEKNICHSLAIFFASLGHQTQTADSAEQALKLLAQFSFDVVLTDYRMAETDGLELLRRIKARQADTLVVLMTAYASVEGAVAAMKAGAHDYVTKPFSLEQIRHIVERAVQLAGLRAENQALRQAIDDIPMLGSQSEPMMRLLETARQAAGSEATILLTGESGTGKNVLARQIHRWSRRAEAPFIVVNCTTLSEQLLESELFGHVRGAFTGAVKDKPGRLEVAGGGTVFLDEIADLPGALQTKFLRFLQEQSFERVGGSKTIRVDARIIAASNRELEAEVLAGRFREDLFYRLNVIMLRMPPLRERREDIVDLAHWLVKALGVRNRRPGLGLSEEACRALLRYHWPGNVRELRNALERAAVLSRSDLITPEDLPDSVFREPAASHPHPGTSATLEDVEREHIIHVLADSATLEEAAAKLGINVTTLWRKRRRYGLD
jgi:NtrC-family two-component system response regulator AlgB